MESSLPGAGHPHPASQPQTTYREIEQELLSFFTPDLLRDLLSEVPGMSLFAVQGALLFAGQKGDVYIMHTRDRGPFFVKSYGFGDAIQFGIFNCLSRLWQD